MQKKLSKDKTVLEIGVGTGRLAVRTAPLCKEFYGIDISTENISVGLNDLITLEEDEKINIVAYCCDYVGFTFRMFRKQRTGIC